MTRAHSEMARRFITLVDVLYEQEVKVIVSAEVEPGSIYQPRIDDDGDDKALGTMPKMEILSTSSYVEKDEEFAFARTVSRLNHMQSAEYLSAAWAAPGKAFIIHLESSTLTEGDLRR
eukprot:TRINITY_DN6642_c0_g2_i1.p1 TRINITY_DN6642_c0_g2~~TRINITY_DN6642_c0_g2_i1.p1  ORF type:complete len:118 (-),score=34.77 TRINITY_DN6642_c0_g2_i1:515-868(-)